MLVFPRGGSFFFKKYAPSDVCSCSLFCFVTANASQCIIMSDYDCAFMSKDCVSLFSNRVLAQQH